MRTASGPDAPWWSVPEDALLRALGTGPEGLSSAEADARADGRAALRARAGPSAARLLLAQFTSPILLVLLAAATLSAFLRDASDAAIILAIVAASGGLGFWQEWRASTAVAALLARVITRATVLRDGVPVELPVAAVVPGDVILLAAGSAVPADCRLLAGAYLHAVEAALTGETFPVEKEPGTAPPGAVLAERRNCLFLGTHIASGTGRALVVRSGAETAYGAIAAHLRRRPRETEFERGARRFGAFLAELTFAVVLGALAINTGLGRPVLESLLYSLALAVGLTPQLLPAVITVNLSHGARRMARAGVIVKRLAAIENLGSMDVLCCDKTGTLTEGHVRIRAALDAEGAESTRTRELAAVNATLQSGFPNPIDAAIRAVGVDVSAWKKLDELPYDFVRKRVSVLAARAGRSWLVSKGAVRPVLEACRDVARADGSTAPLEPLRADVEERFAALSASGLRCLGVAVRDRGGALGAAREDETDMTFVGFLVLEDPPKPDAADTLAALRALGVSVRVITGDARGLAANVARRLGVEEPRVVTGGELREMGDDALRGLVDAVDLFAEVEPNQKERIVEAFRRAGHVVGFLGDGINDAPALHTADVGMSVEGAVDVAREAADLVLLERDLGVLAAGVREGRATFANTLKYVFMAASANFGNMFSMAGAAALFPFLPLLPKQILLTNLLTDLPEMAIASDRVDRDWIDRPHRWDVGSIRRFLFVFGPLSSLFDFATFGVLWWLVRGDVAAFRTGWFVESVVSAAGVVLLLRTRGAALRSRPGRGLALATAAVCAITLALPWSPFAEPLGLRPLPAAFLAALAAVVAAYALSAEAAKRLFFRRERL